MEAFTIPLTLAFGTAFVFLGRWLYRSPARALPGWGLFNREHPSVRKLVKAWAMLIIFVGTFASVGMVLAFLLRKIPGMPLICFAAAIAGTWFFRPKGVPSETVAIDSAAPIQKQRLMGQHWKRNLAIFVGLGCIVLVTVLGILGNSEVCKIAFASAQANPIVRERLGEPVRRGFFTSGSIQISGSTGNANLAIPISGPRGKAIVLAVARKVRGLWKMDTLTVRFERNGGDVNLLQAGPNVTAP